MNINNQTTLTLEQVPGYLLSLGERLKTIEDILNDKPQDLQEEKPFNISEACEWTNLEQPTIYMLSQQGKIPAHKRGKKWYYYASELNEWIKNGGLDNVSATAEESFIAANKKRSGGK